MDFCGGSKTGLDLTGHSRLYSDVIQADQIRSQIESALPGARALVQDTTGTGDHFEVVVVAPGFEGKSLVEQHQLVYGALGAQIKSEAIHALALTTRTPGEWEREKNQGAIHVIR